MFLDNTFISNIQRPDMDDEHVACLCAVCFWIIHLYVIFRDQTWMVNVVRVCMQYVFGSYIQRPDMDGERGACLCAVCLWIIHLYIIYICIFRDQTWLMNVLRVCVQYVFGSFLSRDNTWMMNVLRVCVQYVFGSYI